MFAGILSWSLRSPALVLALATVLLVLGFAQTQDLPVDVLPDLTRPTVSVQVEAAGLAPEDVEAQVTIPLEAALSGLPDVARLRSVSAPGLAIVYAEFAWNSEPYRNRQLVAERLDAARGQWPEGLQPRIGPLTSLMGEVLLIALQAPENEAGPMDLRDHADWTLRPALLAVPGVAQVTVIGGETRQVEIQPDPERLRQFGVSLAELEAATRGEARNLGGGYLDDGGRESVLRSIGRPFDIESLAQVAVARKDGAIVRIGQVADLAIGARIKRGDAGANGLPAVILAIQKQPGVDTLTVTAALEARLAALDAALPSGVQRITVFRQADFIRHSIDNVLEALWTGALIVALVLFAFLRSGRVTLVALVAIPLSAMAAVLALHALGLSINTMTLGGLAIAVGELVDDAVVGVENVVRRLRARAPGTNGAQEIIGRATLEVRSGILYASLLIVLVFVPMLALGGIEGRLFAPLGIAYIAAILASLVVAITVTPVLCLIAYGGPAARLPVEPRWLVQLKQAYVRALARALAHSGVLFATTALLLAAAVIAALNLPQAFLPAFNEGTLTVTVIATPGISLAESDRLGRLAETQLLAVPEVAATGRRTGRAELDEHAEGVHYSEIDVALRANPARSRREIIAAIRAQLAALPAQIAIGQPISHRLDHLLSGVRAPFVVKIVGDDLDTLRAIAAQVRDRLVRVDGHASGEPAASPGERADTLADVQIEPQIDIPQLRVKVDARAAAQAGIAPARAQDALSDLTLGRTLSQIVQGERRYDLVLRLPEPRRRADTLGELLIDGAAGPVPLGTIARLEPGTGANQILREHLRRRIVVSAYPGRGRFDLASRCAAQDLAALPLPPGYEIHVEGQAVSQRAALGRIGGLAVLSLLLMAAVLYGRYRSLRLSLIVLGNVPLAFIGGVAALSLSGTPLSVASLIGFVTLAGIAARNGILKLSHFLHLLADENAVFGPTLVLRGSAERLTPVLMTALIAALALLPLLWDGDAPGKEILHPVALVIFGGLISSTLLDSFLTPALFLRLARPDTAMVENISA